ncbi:hypothetical protein NIES3787_26580 [Microcystis aeruginosa NIES-3787]|uniref:Uncharacterized protein n=1 Tax=Microcystis aeruginosa NIES-3787 TaxID=2517782 RepID=A0A6H9FV55_MICAE|nr:hypothetical protein NIES3787_26580 [Microcystis aeruginosa NIES-3787]
MKPYSLDLRQKIIETYEENIAFPKLVRYAYFLSFCLLHECLKPITFVPQQTEKRYKFRVDRIESNKYRD